MEKENVTTISVAGRGAAGFLEKNRISDRQFVIGVSSNKNPVIDTPFGKIRVVYSAQENGKGIISLDYKDAPKLFGRSKTKREENAIRAIEINDRGVGIQQVRKFDIVVVTDVFRQR